MTSQELDPQELDDLRELCEKATPGPWRLAHAGNMHYGVSHDSYAFPTVVQAECGPDGYGSGSRIQDAEFIAAARSAVPALVAEVERLRAERDRARDIAVALKQQTAEAAQVAKGWWELALGDGRATSYRDGRADGFARCAADLQRVLGVPDDEEAARDVS